MTLADLFSLRHLGAKLGLLAAAGTCILIVVKLLEAAQPVPTPVRVVNRSGEALTLNRLSLGRQTVTELPLSLPPMAGAAPAAQWISRPVDLPPGMPAEASVRVAGAASDLTCALDARPPGVCRALVVFRSATQVTCEFECGQAAGS